MIDDFIKTGSFLPNMRFTVTRFTRFTKNIDCSEVDYVLNLEGKIVVTELQRGKQLHHRRNFSMHLYQKAAGAELANCNKMRLLEFAADDETCHYTGSQLLGENFDELCRLLDQAAQNGGSVDLGFTVEPELQCDATSKYLQITTGLTVAQTIKLQS